MAQSKSRSNSQSKKPIRVAVVGIQGVPATYGGFESLVENLLGENCPPDVHYTVFCSGKDMARDLHSYKGADLKYVPLRANGIQSVPYDMLSLCRCIAADFDAVLVLGVSGGLFIPIFSMISSKPVIVNIDGQEYKRAKWGKFAKWILRLSEAFAVRSADFVIADNKGIQDYVAQTYNRPSELICYGGDHAQRLVDENRSKEILNQYGLTPGDYAVAVCRIEPENNSETVLEAFSKTDKKLVYVGNWNFSDFGVNLKKKYSSFGNIIMADAIYDLDVLYALRANAGVYIHGHSAGGTNPSLVEAMFFGIPILAFDVVYNRETTENRAYYFKDPQSLASLLERKDLDGNQMKEIAKRRYTWQTIASQYCDLFRKSLNKKK